MSSPKDPAPINSPARDPGTEEGLTSFRVVCFACFEWIEVFPDFAARRAVEVQTGTNFVETCLYRCPKCDQKHYVTFETLSEWKEDVT